MSLMLSANVGTVAPSTGFENIRKFPATNLGVTGEMWCNRSLNIPEEES